VFASVFNSMASGGDFVMAIILWRQVPRGAVLRRGGTISYWRASQAGPRPAA